MDIFDFIKPIRNITYHIEDTQQRWFEVLKGHKDVRGVGEKPGRVHWEVVDVLEEPVRMGI